jgi:O-methyltransferase
VSVSHHWGLSAPSWQRDAARVLAGVVDRSREWRKALNGALRRLTGHHLVRAEPPIERAPAPRKWLQVGRIKRYHDDEARATMKSVREWTMTSHWQIFALIVAARYVVDQRVPGDIVECGVWRGGSMQAIARTLLGRGVTDRDLHLFDTFEGMPPPTEEDRRVAGPPARELLESSPKTSTLWGIANMEDVRAGMSGTGYPAERIHYHAGLVEDTLPAEAPESIALLRLDTDWYASTKHELVQLYDRVTPGGVLIVDDYDYWEGSRKAVDEFIAERGLRLLLVPIESTRVAVKQEAGR